MSFNEIINIVLPTFITIIIGYIVGKTVKMEISGVIDIIFYVGLPALAFTSIIYQQFVWVDAVKVFASSILITFGCWLIARVLFFFRREKHTSLYLPISLPNTVNIPFPIISAAYGQQGLFAATLYYIPNIILIYSWGVFVATGKGWRENLIAVVKVPTLYACILALLLNIFNIRVPELVLKPLSFIGGMVIPTVVLSLGYSLAKIKLTSLPTTLIASVIRVGGGLALGYLMVYLFGMTGILKSVVILMSAMPGAMNTYLLAAKYRNEAELVASVVLVTTVFSLVIIPILLNIV